MKSYRELKAIKKPGFYNVGDTLYLSVKPSGSRSWIQRLTIDHKRHDIGLGSFKLVTLAEARDMAYENRKTVRIHKGDPLAEKRKSKMPTFREAAMQTYEALKPRWRNGKHTKNWLQIMERYAVPVIGTVRIDKLGREDVLKILTPLWTKRPETARRLRQKMRTTFKWAQAHGFIENNPAGEMIDGALPTMPAVKEHLRALNYREICAALKIVEQSRSSITAKLAFNFLVLTATRSGEIRCATWDEIDMNSRTWTIQGKRMKGGKNHRIPLSEPALFVLEQARVLRDDSDLIFPSPAKPGNPMSNMTLTKVLRTCGLADKATIHGFRSSFRDWCADTGKPREIAEAALAHIVQGVEGAYFRSDLFERRRLLMEQWAAFVTADRADVVQLHGAPSAS